MKPQNCVSIHRILLLICNDFLEIKGNVHVSIHRILLLILSSCGGGVESLWVSIHRILLLIVAEKFDKEHRNGFNTSYITINPQ